MNRLHTFLIISFLSIGLIIGMSSSVGTVRAQTGLEDAEIITGLEVEEEAEAGGGCF